MKKLPPERIVCVTKETVEALHLLDEQGPDRGRYGCAVHLPEVRGKASRHGVDIEARGKPVLLGGSEELRQQALGALVVVDRVDGDRPDDGLRHRHRRLAGSQTGTVLWRD